MESLQSWRASDGYCGVWRLYEPARPRLADIIYLHGIQSHGGWYRASCRSLAQLGCRVGFLDRRGAGLNFAARGDAPSWQRLVDDVIEFRQQFVTDPPRPCVLLAVSWGAKVATAAVGRWPWLFAGLILIGPGFFPKVRPSLAERCRIALSSLLRPRRQFPIPLNDPVLFTASPDWQQFIRDDRLALRTATARMLVASVLLDRQLRCLAPSLCVPTLLLTAEHDRIIRNKPTRQWLASWASRDLTFREIPGGHHTLEFEPDINGWLPLLQSWLAERFGKQAPATTGL